MVLLLKDFMGRWYFKGKAAEELDKPDLRRVTLLIADSVNKMLSVRYHFWTHPGLDERGQAKIGPVPESLRTRRDEMPGGGLRGVLAEI